MCSSKVAQDERTGQGGAVSTAELRSRASTTLWARLSNLQAGVYWAESCQQVISQLAGDLLASIPTPSNLFQVVARAQINTHKKDSDTRRSISATEDFTDLFSVWCFSHSVNT